MLLAHHDWLQKYTRIDFTCLLVEVHCKHENISSHNYFMKTISMTLHQRSTREGLSLVMFTLG